MRVLASIILISFFLFTTFLNPSFADSRYDTLAKRLMTEKQEASASENITRLVHEIFTSQDKALAINALQYGLTKGYNPFLEYLSALLDEEGIITHGRNNDVIILDSIAEAEDILARLLINDGDIVICQRGAIAQADTDIYRAYGAEVVEFDLADKNDIERLAADLANGVISSGKVKFIQLSSSVNIDEESGQGLLSLAEKFNILLVEDSRRKEPVLSRAKSLKAIDKPGQDSKVIHLRDLSGIFGKDANVGCSYVVLPVWLAEKFEATKGSVTLHPNSFVQILVFKALLTKYGPRQPVATNGAVQDLEMPRWAQDKLSVYGQKIKLSEIRRILKLAAGVKLSEGEVFVSLAGGIPDWHLFPFDKVDELIAGFSVRDWQEALNEAPADGLGALKRAIVKRTNKKLIIRPIKEDEVIVTQGSQEGLDLLGWLSKIMSDQNKTRANEIITQRPTYLGLMSAAEPYGTRVNPYDLNSLKGLSKLEEDLNQRKENDLQLPVLIYVMPTYGNPNGDVMPLPVRNRLLEIARDFGIIIAEDDPYSALRYKGEELPSLIELSRDSGRATVIYLGTVSKIFTPGVRVGWTIAPKHIVDKFKEHKRQTSGGANALTQVLTAKFLDSGLVESHIKDKLIATYSHRRDAMMAALYEYLGDIEDVSWTEGAGGYFIWISLPKGVNTEDMLVFMTTQGIDGVKVGFVPGWPFLGETNQLRLSFPTNEADVIDRAVRALGIAIKNDIERQNEAYMSAAL